MNGKFDKKKILKQIEANRKSARKLIVDAVEGAKIILHKQGLLGYPSSPLAVVSLAEAIFRVEASVVQGRAKIEQVAQQMKAQAEAAKQKNKASASGKQSTRTPIA